MGVVCRHQHLDLTVAHAGDVLPGRDGECDVAGVVGPHAAPRRLGVEHVHRQPLWRPVASMTDAEAIAAITPNLGRYACGDITA